MSGVCCTPNRIHDPFVIQSSRFTWRNAYFSRNSWLPASDGPVPVSREMSGVIRNAMMWLILPLMLM